MKFAGFLLLLSVAVNGPAQTSPDWKITAEPQKEIRANYDTPMKISVKDGKGKPVTAAVELAVTMIGMDHGEYKWPAKMTAPGVYEGSANFFMVGAWNLKVRVKKGRLTKVLTTRVDVAE